MSPGWLVVFENQRHFRAGGDSVSRQFCVLGPHFVVLEDRVARVVDRKEVGVDGEALCVAHAPGLFKTNSHRAPFSFVLPMAAAADATATQIDK